jgi:hypothetical protein
MNKKYEKKIKELLEMRQIFANAGMVGNLQSVNYELARLAKKIGVNYYSLG